MLRVAPSVVVEVHSALQKERHEPTTGDPVSTAPWSCKASSTVLRHEVLLLLPVDHSLHLVFDLTSSRRT